MSKPIEIVPEKKEYLLQDLGEELEDWMEEEVGEYGNKEVNIDRVDMKAIARRSVWVKILRFLLKNESRGFSRKEIKNALKMHESTVALALRKLVKSGVLEKIVSVVDRRFKCYRIVNLKVVESIIKLHSQFVSFKLAKLLPFSYISINSLKKNQKFVNLCEKYRMTPVEGIEALKLNYRKVELVLSDVYETRGQLAGFRRKEQ